MKINYKSNFSTIDKTTFSRLADIVGIERMISDPDILETYAHDETSGFSSMPEAVVRVKSADEVSSILKLANELNFPVTPRGAGTGLSGGAIPVAGGVVMSLEKMDSILEIDADNMTVRVQPGCITGRLHEEVEEKGLFYPPDPASLETCSIGGNVAEDAGGARCLKYGTTRDYVIGLQFVLPTGEITHSGGAVVKDVTGYDLIGLITRSEGTLAVITEITLRLIPLPRCKVDLLVPFDRFDDAPRCVSEVLRRRIIPTAIEFVDNASIKLVEGFLKKEFPHHDAPAHLIFQIDGNNEDELDAETSAIGEVCNEFGAREIFVADDPQTRDRIWECRRAISEAANAKGGLNETLDIVVPRTKVPEAVQLVHKNAKKHGLEAVTFGHAGDGNVHAVLMQGNHSVDNWWKQLHKASMDIYRGTVSLGGKITAEHGIGLTRKPYLSLNVDPAQMRILRGIKKVFDPSGILNPGKIFPDE